MLDEFPKDFEGLPVTRATVDIAKTGHGLDDSLDVEPRAWEVGDVVAFHGTGVIKAVSHPRDQKWKGDGIRVTRDHKADCTALVIVPLDSVEPAIEQERAKVEAVREEQRLRDAEEAAERAEQEAEELERAAGIGQLGRDWTGEDDGPDAAELAGLPPD